VACWSTKAAISLKRVKIEEKLLWGAYRKAPALFRMVPSPTSYGLPFPKIGVRTPPKRPKLQSLFHVPRERVKLWTSNFVRIFIASIGRKPIKNFGKSRRGHSQGLQKMFRALIIYGASRSRSHLCDSSAFLFTSGLERNWHCVSLTSFIQSKIGAKSE